MKKRETIIQELNKHGLHAFHHEGEEDLCMISCEYNDANTSDYYGEFRGGYPYIDPWIEKYAAKNHLMVEWQNPGCLSIHRD